MRTIALAIAGFGMAMPGTAYADTWGSAGGWDIIKAKATCSTFASYAGDTLMLLIFDASDDTATLWVGNKTWTSLKADEKYTLDLSFTRPGIKDQEWSGVTASGIELFETPGFRINFNGIEFLTDFGVSNNIVIAKGDRRIVNLRLTGTMAMVPKLVECAHKVFNENPGDPFAE